jgi:hypothetical protein
VAVAGQEDIFGFFNVGRGFCHTRPVERWYGYQS